GARSDSCLSMRASEIEAAARALSGSGGGGTSFSNPNAQKFIEAVAKDLQAHRGTSLVLRGDYPPASVRQLARALNESLGNAGATVTYVAAGNAPADPAAGLRELAQARDAGPGQLLVILGANPRFTAPAHLKFAERLA